jgi:transcriptional regulator with XRE-family HTH domain
VDDQAEWRRWMQDLGRRLRRAREFLGLSQEQVARLAGVSQGAVSRLETARGLATPLLVAVKVQLAVTGALRGLDPATLSPEVRRALEVQEALSLPLEEVALGPQAITRDTQIEDLIRIYRKVPERHRPMLLRLLEAVAAALKTPRETDT